MRTPGLALLAAALAAASAGAGVLVARSGPGATPEVAAVAAPRRAAAAGHDADRAESTRRASPRPDATRDGPETASAQPQAAPRASRASLDGNDPAEPLPGVPAALGGSPDTGAAAPRPRRPVAAVEERWIEPPDADERGASSVTMASAPVQLPPRPPSPASLRGPAGGTPGTAAGAGAVATIATIGTAAVAPDPPAPPAPPDPDPPPVEKPKPEPKPDPKPDPEPEPKPEPDPDDDTASHGPTRVILAAEPGPLAPDAELRVHVLIENAGGVASVPFHLRFDPRVLRFEQALQGPFMGSDGQAAIVMAAPLSSGDVVVVGAARLGAVPGVSGSGEICTLRFRVLAPGATTFTFSEAAVRAPSGADLPASFLTTTVVVP